MGTELQSIRAALRGLLLANQPPHMYGGQAVIEGVMMRVPGAYATALRLKNGKIIAKKYNFKSIIDKKNRKKNIIIK